MATAPYPNEVLGRVLHFLPRKQIPKIATSDNDLPDIFLLYAPYDGVFRPKWPNGEIIDKCQLEEPTLSKCIYNPSIFNIYQPKDIQTIINSGLIPSKYILQTLANRGELGMIQSYWNIFMHTETDDLICKSIGQIWNQGICIAITRDKLITFIWMWEQFRKIITNLNLDKETWTDTPVRPNGWKPKVPASLTWNVLFKKCMRGCCRAKYRSSDITKNLFIKLIYIELVFRAMNGVHIISWLMLQNDVLDCFPDTLKNLLK